MKDNKMKFKIEGAAITALAIVAVILLNLIFSVLGEKVNLKLDLTGGGVFTLSDESKAVAEGADKEVDIYYATNAQNRNTRYSEILETFGRANDLISVKEVHLFNADKVVRADEGLQDQRIARVSVLGVRSRVNVDVVVRSLGKGQAIVRQRENSAAGQVES